MPNYYLSIDNGGTNTKVVIFDEKGKQMASSAFPTLCLEDQSGFREVDMTNLWKLICDAIKDVLNSAKLRGTDITAVACVGHGKGVYLLDKHKQIFTNGILSTDERGKGLAKTFESKVSEIWPLSHQHVVAAQSPILLRWLKENKPETYFNIGYALSAKDFVRFKLTNQLNQEIGDASGNNLINLENKDYDQRLFDFFGISEARDFLPPLVNFDEVVGGLSAEVASVTGLIVGTPVVGGLFDIHACALASGVVDTNFLNVIAGTWSINTYLSEVPVKESSGLMNSLFPGEKYLVESSSATSAGNLNLMIQLLMKEEQENSKQAGSSLYETLEDFLTYTDGRFSKVIFLPFLYGSNSHVNAQGSFIGIKDTTTKSELIRAVYEGIVFAHKNHVDLLLETRQNKPQQIRLSGGAVNSPQWIQMFADILEMPVETVRATEQGGLGGAIAAAIGSGKYSSIEIAIAEMVHVERRVEPQPNMVRLYQQKYQVYQSLLRALTGAWDELANMRNELEGGA